MSVTEKKSDLRARMTARRAAAVSQDAAAALRDRFLDAFADRLDREAAISGFWPIGDEIDPRPLLRALDERGCVCALPVVVGRGLPLVFRRWRPDDALVAAKFGLSEPAETAASLDPDIVIAPLLAVDPAGRRLGYGGGFYDRTIRALRGRREILAVGIGYDVQVCAAVPADETDERVDWIVTEARTLRCAEDAGPGA